MKKIKNHSLQYENLIKKGFKFLPYDKSQELEDKLISESKKCKNLTELSKLKSEVDKELEFEKKDVYENNLSLLKNHPNWKVPMYVYYGYDDETFINYTPEDIKLEYNTKFPTFKLGELKQSVWSENAELLFDKLKPLEGVFQGSLYVVNSIATEHNVNNTTCDVKYGKTIVFKSSFISFDIIPLSEDKVYITEVISYHKKLGAGNLLLCFILLQTLQLDIILEGVALVPSSEKIKKDVPDYHILKKYYQKFELEFDCNGWGKKFSSKKLIGNHKYLSELYSSLELFIESWIDSLSKLESGEQKLKQVA